MKRILLTFLVLGFFFTSKATNIQQPDGDSIKLICPKTEQIEKIIGDAISLGAPIYNEGLILACCRIYEWSSYKILYEYGTVCPEVNAILKTAIDKTHGDYSDAEKAWIMRVAFDKILGVPTQTTPLKKEEPIIPQKG